MLVFLLGAIAGIVAFFIAVKILNLTNVMHLLFFSNVDNVFANS